jgi:hypothetical protein
MSNVFWLVVIVWAVAFFAGWAISWGFATKPTLGDIIKGMFMLPAWVAILVSWFLIAVL